MKVEETFDEAEMRRIRRDVLRNIGFLCALIVLLLVFGGRAEPAEAEPTPTPTAGMTFQSWAMTLMKPGTDRTFIAGARAHAYWQVQERVTLDIRIDASAISDGGAVPEFKDPASFSTLELYAAARVRVVGPLSLIALGGYVLPTEGGQVEVIEQYPVVVGGGIHVATPGRWAMIAFGRDDAAGPGLKVLVSGESRIDGRLSVVADGALGGAGSFLRAGVAVKVLR